MGAKKQFKKLGNKTGKITLKAAKFGGNSVKQARDSAKMTMTAPAEALQSLTKSGTLPYMIIAIAGVGVVYMVTKKG